MEREQMTRVPLLTEPPGDPVGVRAAAQRLEQTSAATVVTARRLSAANDEVLRAWDSDAQRMFSVMASGWANIAASAANIMGRLAEAMLRYAAVLEASQAEVREARARLQNVVATAPAGTALDPASTSAILAQARQASETAARAAAELTATAAELIGPINDADGTRTARDAGATLVSRSHNAAAGFVPTATARSFDAQARGLEHQIAGAITGIVGLASRPVGVPGGQIVFSPQDRSSGQVVFSPQDRSQGAITFAGTQHAASDSRSLVQIPVTLFSSNNPYIALNRAIAEKHARSLRQWWRRLYPDEAPPEGNALEIRRAMLERGYQLGPIDFAAASNMGVGTINNSLIHTVREGYEVVRRDGRPV